MRLLSDRVLIEVIEPDEQTKAGIIIPKTVRPEDAAQMGNIIDVGPGAINEQTGKRMPMTVRQDQCVLFGQYSGVPIQLKGEDCLMLHEPEIFAIVT